MIDKIPGKLKNYIYSQNNLIFMSVIKLRIRNQINKIIIFSNIGSFLWTATVYRI